MNIILFLVSPSSSLISCKSYQSNFKTDFPIQNNQENLYTVKRNESLWAIAGRRNIYNNPFAWSALLNANRKTIKNPKSMLVGLTINIPVLLPFEKMKYEKIRDNYFKFTFPTVLKNLFRTSKQFLIVTSRDWNSTTADFIYYEKKKNKLLQISDTLHVNLGRHGLGWGYGLVELNTSHGPIKYEGDDRSPAGIFKLSYSFGYLPKDSLRWLKYPYRQVTSTVECVDDSTSKYYNTLVNTDKINKTWRSSEIMKSEGIHYKYGIFVDHNSKPSVSGCGSCIFLHVSSSFGKPTSGCTSMSEDQIVKLLHWLDAKKKPLLIQLLEADFNKIKSILNL